MKYSLLTRMPPGQGALCMIWLNCRRKGSVYRCRNCFGGVGADGFLEIRADIRPERAVKRLRRRPELCHERIRVVSTARGGRGRGGRVGGYGVRGGGGRG